MLLVVFVCYQIVLEKSSRIARCARRIVEVAKGEVENIEDPTFKREVDNAAEGLARREYNFHAYRSCYL